MKRDLNTLGSEVFDVLVIGAGIYGATLARAAALQGLRVALIDRSDFGGATSANSLKIIHGGLRYLQHLDFSRMRESIKARRRLLKLAPHLVRPLPCIVPTYGHGLRSRSVLAAALLANELVSWDRNKGVTPIRHLPRGSILSRKECIRLIPGLEPKGVTGAALWFDALAEDTERLTLAFVHSAAEAGACVANYVSARHCLIEGNRVIGAAAVDEIGMGDLEIRSRVVVNCAGPWANQVTRSLPDTPGGGALSWAKAVNIVVRRPLFASYAVGLSGRDRYMDRDTVFNKGMRDFFFVPWRDGTMIGTSYTFCAKAPEVSVITESELTAIVEQINYIYPAAKLHPEEVCLVHQGLLPMGSGSQERQWSIQLRKDPQVTDWAKLCGLQGLLTVVGVKYTTAVQLADHVLSLVLAQLGRHNLMTWKEEPPLWGGEVGWRQSDSPASALEAELAERFGMAAVNQLKSRYGARFGAVLKYLRNDKENALLSAEIRYVMTEEMAMTLPNVILGRMGLGNFSRPRRSSLETCADIMAQELGWSQMRRTMEINEVENAYTIASDMRRTSALSFRV